jgi:hypothetical protein
MNDEVEDTDYKVFIRLDLSSIMKGMDDQIPSIIK